MMRTPLLAFCLAIGIAAPAQAHGLPGTAPVAPGPSDVAVNPVTNTAYVASGLNKNGPNFGGHTVSVIDTRQCNARNVDGCGGPWPTVNVGEAPSAVAVDAATNTVYVTSDDDHTLSVIDGSRCNGRTRAGCGDAPTTI